jgi:hypothetical protein
MTKYFTFSNRTKIWSFVQKLTDCWLESTTFRWIYWEKQRLSSSIHLFCTWRSTTTRGQHLTTTPFHSLNFLLCSYLIFLDIDQRR